MTPKELITKIQKKADTQAKGSHIPAPDVSRVVALVGDEFLRMKPLELLQTVAGLVANAQKRREKERSK